MRTTGLELRIVFILYENYHKYLIRGKSKRMKDRKGRKKKM